MCAAAVSGLCFRGWMLYPALVFGALQNITEPCLQAVMAAFVGADRQGGLQVDKFGVYIFWVKTLVGWRRSRAWQTYFVGLLPLFHSTRAVRLVAGTGDGCSGIVRWCDPRRPRDRCALTATCIIIRHQLFVVRSRSDYFVYSRIRVIMRLFLFVFFLYLKGTLPPPPNAVHLRLESVSLPSFSPMYLTPSLYPPPMAETTQQNSTQGAVMSLRVVGEGFAAPMFTQVRRRRWAFRAGLGHDVSYKPAAYRLARKNPPLSGSFLPSCCCYCRGVTLAVFSFFSMFSPRKTHQRRNPTC